MPKQERKKISPTGPVSGKSDGSSSMMVLFEFVAKVAPSLLSSRDAALSVENLHPMG